MLFLISRRRNHGVSLEIGEIAGIRVKLESVGKTAGNGEAASCGRNNRYNFPQ